MALNVKVIGLDRTGFRIKGSGGNWQRVTSAEAVEVNVQDPSVQRVLKRNHYRVLAFPENTFLT